MFFLILILVLNFGISWWNCYAVGSVWKDANAMGGFSRVLVWCGAIQSVAGFSMAFLVPVAFGGSAILVGFGSITPEDTRQLTEWTFSLWYVGIIFPVLGSGILITIHSWREAIARKDWSSMGIAGWNTIATGYNIYNMTQSLGPALSQAGGALKAIVSGGDTVNEKLARFALAFVLISLAGGFFLTYYLISKYSTRAQSLIPAEVRNAERIA